MCTALLLFVHGLLAFTLFTGVQQVWTQSAPKCVRDEHIKSKTATHPTPSPHDRHPCQFLTPMRSVLPGPPRPKPIHITCSAALTRALPHGTCGLSATFMGLSIPGTYVPFPASFTANSLRTGFRVFVPLLYGLEFSTYTCKHKHQIRLLIPDPT